MCCLCIGWTQVAGVSKFFFFQWFESFSYLMAPFIALVTLEPMDSTIELCNDRHNASAFLLSGFHSLQVPFKYYFVL